MAKMDGEVVKKEMVDLSECVDVRLLTGPNNSFSWTSCFKVTKVDKEPFSWLLLWLICSNYLVNISFSFSKNFFFLGY